MRKIVFVIVFFTALGVQAQISDIPQNTRFYFDGSIESIDQIQMNLNIDDLEITGGFVMENSGEHYFVEGRLSSDKSGIGIRVYDSSRKYKASIEAKVVSEDGNIFQKIIGVFKPAGTNNRKNLVLQKIAEFANNYKMADVNNS